MDDSYKCFEDAKWFKIFSHDYSQKSKFTESEALHCTDKPDKYSILDSLSSRDKIKEFGQYYFEFLYEFKNGNSNLYYMRWIQSNNPLEQREDAKSSTVPGFKNLSSNFQGDRFGGLARTTFLLYNDCYPSLLNGVVNNTQWYYAIGIYDICDRAWDYNYIPSIPSRSKTTYVVLWIRVMKQATCYKSLNFHISILFYLFFLCNP